MYDLGICQTVKVISFREMFNLILFERDWYITYKYKAVKSQNKSGMIFWLNPYVLKVSYKSANMRLVFYKNNF